MQKSMLDTVIISREKRNYKTFRNITGNNNFTILEFENIS